jgi:hypothetical protein
MAATTSTVLYPTPPTANKLASSQKMRLMRSTRKLGQMLGTTPHLLDGSLPITLLPVGHKKSSTAPRRERSMFASSSTVSFESNSSASDSSRTPSPAPPPLFDGKSDILPVPHPGFSDLKRDRSINAPHPLYICLNTVPVSPSDNRFVASLPPTPTTANHLTAGTSYSFPSTPCTPTFDHSEVRRKRMAKLARHLGEVIPPQLVSSLPRRRRSMSIGGPGMASELGFSQHKPAVSYCPGPSIVDRQVSWIGEWNRDDMEDVQKQLRALKGR